MLSWIKIAGILIILGGVIWVIFEENSYDKGEEHISVPRKDQHSTLPGNRSIRGILYAFLGAITQAVGLVFAKAGMEDGIHPVTTNLLRIAAGLIGLFAYSLVRKKVRSDFRSFNSPGLLLLLLFAVVIGPVLGIILSLYALNRAPVGIVTSLMQVSPIMLLPVDVFILKKKVSVKAVLGTLLAVSGAVLLFLY